MKLTSHDLAYNAVVEALNESEDKLRELLAVRDRQWRACEALMPIGSHGGGSVSHRRIEVVRTK